jgi:hypothetical protein
VILPWKQGLRKAKIGRSLLVLARPIQTEYPGAICHVMALGNGQGVPFFWQVWDQLRVVQAEEAREKTERNGDLNHGWICQKDTCHSV